MMLGETRALYVGELPATGWHCHAAPVLLIGLSGRFALHLPAGRESCRSALIDCGVEHVFDPCGERVALMYLEPDALEARRLRSLFRAQGAVIFDPAAAPVARSHVESRLRSFDLDALLRHHVPEPGALDLRVQHSMQYLRLVGAAPAGREGAADAVSLSASRFNHLFREETGVSFRSYRVWAQVRAAMAGMGPHINLTEAALHGAFADSSHFSRTFRKTFGMTPSTVLKPLKELSFV